MTLLSDAACKSIVGVLGAVISIVTAKPEEALDSMPTWLVAVAVIVPLLNVAAVSVVVVPVATIGEPVLTPSTFNWIVSPTTVLPTVNVGVSSLVTLSELLLPVSLPIVRSGVSGMVGAGVAVTVIPLEVAPNTNVAATVGSDAS